MGIYSRATFYRYKKRFEKIGITEKNVLIGQTLGNNRIINITDGKVSFLYKNPKTGMYNRKMTLAINEFIRRFMQHILPCGFYKIRYFGILATANIKSKKDQCLALLAKQPFISTLEGLNNYEDFKHITGKNPSLCKKCKTGTMEPVLSANTG